jgi:hypothetical protein
MRTYYRDAKVYLTSSAIWVDERRYPLDQIEGAWRRSRGMPGGRLLGQLAILIGVGAIGALGVGLGLAGHVGGAASGALARLFRTTGGLVVVGVLGLALSVLVVLAIEAVLHGLESARRFGRQQELWIRIRGVDTVLLSTADSVRFGKIYRALARALGDR